MSKKYLILGMLLFALIPLVVPLNAVNAMPPWDPYEVIIDVGIGGAPYTMDPANCYDTASAELIFNVYETLIFFDGEQYNTFIPQLADQAWVGPPDPLAPEYTNFTMYFRIRKTWWANVTNLDLTSPVSTQWKQGYYCNDPWGMEWHLEEWLDTNPDGHLGNSDIVVLRNKLRPYLCRLLHVQELALCSKPPNTYWYMRLQPMFHTWSRSDLSPVPTYNQYYLEIADVERSFERWMVYDYIGGPTWLIYNPLLACMGSDVSDPNWGQKIDDSVQSNATHVWLNIANKNLATGGAVSWAPIPMFDEDTEKQRNTFWAEVAAQPLGFPLSVFLQVISQSWASVMSKQWLDEWLDPAAEAAGHPVGEWPGDWSNWTLYNYPTSPLIPGTTLPCTDTVPGGAANPGVMCGTGPFILQRIDYALEWSIVRNPYYWRCRPRPWPYPPYPPQPEPPVPTRPKGWVERITERQRATSARIAEFIAGDCDFGGVPRARVNELHVGSNRFGPTLTGIRLNMPIPAMTVDSFHFTFNVSARGDNRYGIIYDADDLHADGIPENFFANIATRKAFAHLINFTMIIQDQYLGEAYQPCTFAPTGLPYVYCNNTKYYYDETLAEAYFRAAMYGGTPLMNVGFKVTITYNTGNTVRQAVAEQVASAVNVVCNKIAPRVDPYAVPYGDAWGNVLGAMDAHELPIFLIGWLADYADIHNFLVPYLHSEGTFPLAQRYSNPAIDALLDQGIYLPDGPDRSQIYNDAMILGYQDVPTVPTAVAVGRGYLRDRLQGMYYNVLYPGYYGCNKWKWPITTTPGTEGYLPGDVDFSGAVTMGDIIATVNAFGSYYGKLGMPVFHPRWNFYCDMVDIPQYRWSDRKIDMGDIVTGVAFFGKTSSVWVPPP